MTVHVCRATTAEQIFVAISAFEPVFASVVASGSDRLRALSGKHFIDPEIMRRVVTGTVGNIFIEDLLQIAG